MYFFFFFQAEDGIRDLYVTGVQTCALPISTLRARAAGLRGEDAVGETVGERAERGIEVHGEVGVGVHDPAVVAGPARGEGGAAHGQRIQRVGRLSDAARHEVADRALPRVVVHRRVGYQRRHGSDQ